VNSVAVELAALCFGANDPGVLARGVLARFWATALRWNVQPRPHEFSLHDSRATRLVRSDSSRFDLMFVPVSDAKNGKNRLHLDLTTASLEDQTETVEALLELGARRIDIGQGPADPHVVLADPEGNELCVIEPTNQFLAGCGRLGSVTCDGTRTTGHFWSHVLGWPLVWDEGEETVIRAPDGSGPMITWGPPVPPKAARNRLHLHLVPAAGATVAEEVARATRLGAVVLDAGHDRSDGVVLADPDGNEFWVTTGR
jgi:hypothetical protein